MYPKGLRLVWEMFILFALIVNSIYVPLSIGFEVQAEGNNKIKINY